MASKITLYVQKHPAKEGHTFEYPHTDQGMRDALSTQSKYDSKGWLTILGD